MHQPLRTFASFLCTAENRAALLAVQELAQALASGQTYPGNPLYLFGPPGTGKTHLVSALAEEMGRVCPELVVRQMTASDFTQANYVEEDNAESLFASARAADLLLVEDVQHFHVSAIGPFTELVDALLINGQQLVITAHAGPQELRHGNERFPARLVNRLAGGMTVSLQTLQQESRLRIIRNITKHLNISENLLLWLASNLTGGVRQLLGAARQLEGLTRESGSLELEQVVRHFQAQADSGRVTVEHIIRQVSAYFRVEPQQLCSAGRWRNILVPRQVSMYLARRLTGLSLEQIGAYFGGRDHSTVLHACRKVEEALDRDVALSGAIRQLQAELL